MNWMDASERAFKSGYNKGVNDLATMILNQFFEDRTIVTKEVLEFVEKCVAELESKEK